MTVDRRALLGLAMAGGASLATGTAWAAPRRRLVADRDLTGIWTNAWYTQLQRPKDFKTLVVSAADAEA